MSKFTGGRQDEPRRAEHVVHDVGRGQLFLADALLLHAETGPHPRDGAAEGAGAQPEGGQQADSCQQGCNSIGKKIMKIITKLQIHHDNSFCEIFFS